MQSIFYGLGSALIWGAADFCGGVASRKARPYQAVLLGEAVGLALLLGVVAFVREPALPWRSWLLCSLAGALGVLGLLLFFIALERGQMTVAAPVSALLAAFLPVIAGTLMEGFPGILTFIGFSLALLAIWFISRTDESLHDLRLHIKGIWLPLLAGVTFGFYLILIHKGSGEQLILPLVAARSGGTLTMLLFVLIARKPVKPTAAAVPFVLLNGLLDVSGNGLYILAGQSGRMDVAAVLASLYPASTVLLAWLFLHERINRPQSIGILAALVAIVLMTI